jgi:hypothetical protein
MGVAPRHGLSGRLIARPKGGLDRGCRRQLGGMGELELIQEDGICPRARCFRCINLGKATDTALT